MEDTEPETEGTPEEDAVPDTTAERLALEMDAEPTLFEALLDSMPEDGPVTDAGKLPELAPDGVLPEAVPDARWEEVETVT